MLVLPKLRIAGSGSYLPERVVSNDDLAGRTVYYYDNLGKRITPKGSKVLDPEGIFEVTGIRERRYAYPEESPVSMGYIAACRALESAKINPGELEGVYFASVTERDFPGGAADLLNRLGIRGKFTRNVSMACCSFIEAVNSANERCVKRPGNYLVVASDTMSRIVQQDDINVTLFGDGAGAMVLVPSEDSRGIVADYSSCDPSDGKLDYIVRDPNGFVRMADGNAVFKRAVPSMVEAAKEVKRLACWDHADVYFPHQANGRILKSVEDRVEDSGSIVYKNIENCGNMAGATCAVAFDQAIRDGTAQFSSSANTGSKVVFVAFASGLLTSAFAAEL